MRHITGETVVVDLRTLAGYDTRGNELWSYEPVTVDNVLVGASYVGTWTNDRIQDGRPEGMWDNFTLYFPKEWDRDLRGARVHLRGITVEVIGEPERFIDANLPFGCAWNLVVKVSRYEG